MSQNVKEMFFQKMINAFAIRTLIFKIIMDIIIAE